jgi:hypothetical protein
MTDQTKGAGAGSGSSSQGSQSGGDHPAFNNPVSKPAAPPPEYDRGGRLPENPRSRGHSPALDARGRQQEQPAGTQGAPGGDQHGEQGQQGHDQGQQGQQGIGAIEIDGVSWTHDQVREAIAGRVEQDARKAALPPSPDKYEVTLPPDFKPPEGVKFEFDPNSADLKRFREVAHKRGMDQESFSDALGVYASTKISEQQQLAHARGAEMAKLGSAAPGRIDAIDTWLKARVGQNGALMAAQLRNFPVASMVEMFEGIMRSFSGQGGAEFRQDGRQQEDNTGKIAGYDQMTFMQRRAAQEALNARGRGGSR